MGRQPRQRLPACFLYSQLTNSPRREEYLGRREKRGLEDFRAPLTWASPVAASWLSSASLALRVFSFHPKPSGLSGPGSTFEPWKSCIAIEACAASRFFPAPQEAKGASARSSCESQARKPDALCGARFCHLFRAREWEKRRQEVGGKFWERKAGAVPEKFA